MLYTSSESYAVQLFETTATKEHLKEINYNFEYVIIDKFWNSIQHDKWVYINEDMLKYIGYNSNEIYHAKSNYIKLIKDIRIF